jgi:hypothetical protein
LRIFSEGSKSFVWCGMEVRRKRQNPHPENFGSVKRHLHRASRRGLAALVVQMPLGQFSCEGIPHSDLLIARVKITAYNPARFFRASVVSATKFTRS